MEKRTEKIRVRLTPDELEYLKKCSGSFSLRFKNGKENLSAYLRELMLSESKYKSQLLEERMKGLQYEIRKVGTNINQVTRKINGNFGTASDITELKALLKSIEQKLDRLTEETDIWRSQN